MNTKLIFLSLILLSTMATSYGTPIDYPQEMIKIRSKNSVPFNVNFKMNMQGIITYLQSNDFYFNEFAWGSDRDIANIEQGYFDVIPKEYIDGACTNNDQLYNCKIKVHFTEEEVTTIFINFNLHKMSGNMEQLHSDQAIKLFHKKYSF